MSFGRNPFAAKAEAAELKAASARDSMAREQAWREAAHNWDRAADREKDNKRKQQYADKAAVARTQVESSDQELSQEPAAGATSTSSTPSSQKKKPSPLN